MKIIILISALLAITLQLLDRSYYDALSISSFTKIFQLVRVRKKFDKLLDNNQENTIQTEILDQDSAFKR
jgi:hypothetical protein